MLVARKPLWRQTRVFVTTNICRNKHNFVATSIFLSRQKLYLWQELPMVGKVQGMECSQTTNSEEKPEPRWIRTIAHYQLTRRAPRPPGQRLCARSRRVDSCGVGPCQGRSGRGLKSGLAQAFAVTDATAGQR